MSRNTNLNNAKAKKDDEFYTLLSDIENELGYYKEHFKSKVIYLNCDSEKSNFWKYFYDNFDEFGATKIIATHFDSENNSYKLEYFGKDIVKTKLKGNGDFRSPECVELLKSSDVVVTNPPFSLFRALIGLLTEYDRNFILVGNLNAITNKNMIKKMVDMEITLGITYPKSFLRPDNTIQKLGNVCWYTNIKHNVINDYLKLTKKYNEVDYPKYDNYNAINVDKIKDIPLDYDGVMGVPITIFEKFNPDQFEIVGDSEFINDNKCKIVFINGLELYKRILIKQKIS